MVAPASSCTNPIPSGNTTDLDVSEEELQHLLSQRDLATTLAENLLKHFGSDEIDHVKEETETTGLSFSKIVFL